MISYLQRLARADLVRTQNCYWCVFNLSFLTCAFTSRDRLQEVIAWLGRYKVNNQLVARSSILLTPIIDLTSTELKLYGMNKTGNKLTPPNSNKEKTPKTDLSGLLKKESILKEDFEEIPGKRPINIPSITEEKNKTSPLAALT